MRGFIIGLTVLCCVTGSAAPANAQGGFFRPPEQVEAFKVLRLEGNAVRWQQPADGTDLVITYRVLNQATSFSGARNCRRMTSLDALMASSRVSDIDFRQELAAAFAMWEAVAGLSFREARDDEHAHIIVGAQVEPEGWAFADVFYDAASSEQIKPISLSLVCLNPARSWKVGFDGDLKTYDLRYTLAHEIGHAIGLDHPSGPGQIMGYRYEERFRALQPGDVRGAIALYGERQRDGDVVEHAKGAPQPTHDPQGRSLGTRALEARSP